MGKFTQKSMNYLKSKGYSIGPDAIVERWIPGWGKKQDFLSCIDFFAFRKEDQPRMMAVQSCGQDIAAHRQKIDEALKNDFRVRILMEHCPILLIGWTKRKIKRGGKAWRWREKLFWYGF